MPGSLLRAMGRLTDFAQKIVPFQTHLSAEAMAYVTQWSPADSGRIRREAGLQFRSGEETFSDAIRGLARAGHLQPGQAGRLATT
jgi:hypothetical protein